MWRAAAIGSVLAVCVASCGSDGGDRSQSAYCAAVAEHGAELTSPNIATAADIDRTLQLYQSMVDQAPLQIEDEWKTMLTSVQTASTVDPADPASLQRVADVARASKADADTVITYTRQLCGTTIGNLPVVTATTLAPTTT